MSRELKIQEFDDKQVRIVWDDEEQKCYFSVTDVVRVLTKQPDARGATVYWVVLKKRLKQEGANELITNCKQLKKNVNRLHFSFFRSVSSKKCTLLLQMCIFFCNFASAKTIWGPQKDLQKLFCGEHGESS